MKTLRLCSLLLLALPALNVVTAQSWSSGSGRLYTNPSSTNVGIGTSSPKDRLHVQAGSSGHTGSYNSRAVAIFESSSSLGTTIELMAKNTGVAGIGFGRPGSAGTAQITYSHSKNEFSFYVSGRDIMFMDYYGVRIGPGSAPNPAGYLFAVDGKAIAEELTVKLSQNWPDYVFEQDYKLMPLQGIERFVKENGHLPGVPSAAEVEAEGAHLGALSATLLQKIEELTLHAIAQEKKVSTLERELRRLRTERD